MREKKHNLIYQITNLVNGKIYIGRHITNNINDCYMGSGHEIQKAVKKYGVENFKKEILFDFKTIEEMIEKENELLTEEFVNSKNSYNIVVGGSSGMIGKTHGERVRQILREANTGLVSVKDKDGNNLKVTKDDPRYLSGELKHNTHGTVLVKDKEGNKFRVPFDDPRRLTGELISANTGTKQTPERIQNRVEKNLEWWKNNSHSEEGIQRMREANVGKVNVKDKDGNEFRVSVDDERYLSGELVVACKGSIWIHNDDLQKSRFIKPENVQKYLDVGWIKGLVYYNKKILITIKNDDFQQTKRVPEDKLQEYFNNGWVKGRIVPKDMGEKIKAGRNPGTWMRNPDTGERRIIIKTEVDQYLKDGWISGRGKLK